MKIIDLTCPRCGATMKPDLDKGHAICEYCGHQVLIKQEDTIEEIRAKAQSKAYGYHKGKLKAEEEARKKKKPKGKLIAAGIVAAIVLSSVMSEELAKPRVNPFDCIEVSFQGKDGDGNIVIDIADTANIDVDNIDYEISKKRNLYQGDTVSINATSRDYRLTETTRTYTVEGLDEYLKDLEAIPEEALEVIHMKAEARLALNLERSKNAEMFVDMKPVKLFLATDGKQTNELYDVFEVHFTTRSGEKTFYVMAYFDDVIVRNSEQVSIDMSYGMYMGHLIQVEGSLWITGYNSLEEIRADLLTSQESYMELKELEL